ncbi:hypothetical protein [Geobacter sp. SVR]|uniref:hypothetical protein n=1 Tax=Geobacter sp. SVR TaxID=2495594 RepID=UPI00143EF9C4|nr:hypothetical protein [Geobacter sp. SVR]BCS52031.1 hypothetical protein GSVR_03390 [Geobacter sp. SVR]GCF87155.1 hypothetical protein GSbR_37550 [Geobacter sp. SVR]
MAQIRITSTAEQTPADFMLGERIIRVRTVVDRWFGEDHAYFKVITEDGTIYILRHDLELDQWELTLMDGLVAKR